MRADVSGVVYGVPFRTNASGFRDPDGSFPPPRSGELRVAVLGDSFTVGAGVPFDALFTSALERRLESQGRDATVLNLAVGGYNIVQYERVLREVALGLEPDLLVVALYPPNDFDSSTYRANRAIALGERDRDEASGLWHRLHALRALTSALLGLRDAARAALGERPEWSPPGWEENASALLRIAETVRSRETPLLVLLLTGNFDRGLQEPQHRRILAFCRARSLACASTLLAFRESGRSPRGYTLNLIDAHPNPAYHDLVADTLARTLERRELLPSEE